MVTESHDAVDGTRITFTPDLAKFGLTTFDHAICELFKKRTYDVAGTLRGVNVYYNGNLVEVPSFQEYVSLYSDDHSSNDVLYVNASRRWQWAVRKSPTGFQQISFVNNIATTGGGKHVDYIVDQIVNIIKPLVDSHLKNGIKKVAIKHQLCVFVNALIENPAFTSQTKDVLTTAVREFGSKCECDAERVQAWAIDSGLVDELTSEAQAKEDYMTTDFVLFKATASKEINHMMRILGLTYGENYSIAENRAKLRYGGIIILTDQDEDGSHIKGLIINFLYTFWPELLHSGFVQSFMTPLLKARNGSETISFYSMEEFKNWKVNTENADKYTVKYYKGLGTSTSKEAREYFSNFEKHLVNFRYEDEEDGESLRMVFDKRRADDRKQWINKMLETDCVDHTAVNEATYKEFVDNELFRYSLLDLKVSHFQMI
ncbi:unnamed protein product [Strongylus vulgaris]|uniref:DNA topoisomerase 2 n=1 Tax=Strongylus vulgaris TaxID=40348 RepID=A0A3P7JN09_STRVU|nr:unnamed protein product [Strongylus vulgaris]